MVEALENSWLYGIPYDALHELIESNKEIEHFYRNVLEHALISSQEHADSQRFENASERYERLHREKPEIILRAPLVHIASFLQMMPETLSRVRNASHTPSSRPSLQDQNAPWWMHATRNPLKED